MDSSVFTRLKKLSGKLKNKTVILYGAGKFLAELNEQFDFSEFNVLGIADKKFLPEDSGKTFGGFKIIPYCMFNPNNADYILVTLQNPAVVEKYFKSFNAKNIITLTKPDIKKRLQNFYNKHFAPKNNTFVLIKRNGHNVYNPKIKNLEVKFFGKNNYLEIHEPFKARSKVYISCYNNSKITIGSDNVYNKAQILLGTNNQLAIGSHTTIEDGNIVLARSNNTKLIIGNDCQIAWKVNIRTNDAHTIYDCNTRKAINIPQDTTIGNHVWITANTTVLKGSIIPSNCIVGTQSVVNKKFTEENCVLAGAPAKVVKTGVNWDRREVADFPFT